MKKTMNKPEPMTDDMHSGYILFGLLFFVMGAFLLFGDFWAVGMPIIMTALVKIVAGWLLVSGVGLLSTAEQEHRRRQQKKNANHENTF